MMREPKSTMNEDANSVLSTEFAEIGVISKTEYSRLKRKALRFEPQNLRYILVVPCSGEKGWCEMSDHSALFYKYLICEKLGVNVSMMDDFDSYYDQYRIGRVRTRGWDLVRVRVKNAGYYKGEAIKDRCLMIELKRSISLEQLKKLEDEEMHRQEGLNEIVKSRPVDPVLYQKMIEVATRLHRLCFRHMDLLSSETNGKRMVESMDVMLKRYHDVSDKITGMSDEEITKVWRDLQAEAHAILIELQIVAGLKLWKRETCISIGEGVMAIEDRIGQRLARHLLNIEKKERDKNGVEKKTAARASRPRRRDSNSVSDRAEEVAAE